MPNFWDCDEFTRSYITTALWAETDGSDDNSGGEPFERNYSANDIDDETFARMIADCKAFQETNSDDIDNGWSGIGSCNFREQAGYDFWLTRNGHGAGFWDGDWEFNENENGQQAGERLTEACKTFGEFSLYLGDDGKIYGCQG